ncbi:phosphate ABC transporter permease PstA [Halostella salina]|uniref:phosphate ABC transporter permease PstA n=1 Tax=Halostella salina TaxID=1547897 RepID=UPI000EF7E3C5|nr:phosphate ABC transporter permease PstA [Halostella salina]
MAAERDDASWFGSSNTTGYWKGRLFEFGCLAATLFGILMVLALLAYVFIDAFALFEPQPAWLDIGFLTSAHSRFPERAGIFPALVGSVMMMLVIALSAFPVGVGAAIYLEEYAPDNRITSLIEVNIGNLAGVPSVVYGLLGLAVFVRFGGLGSGTVVVGGFTVGLLILPIVIISAQEAIRGVPDSMRQASYGMGATRWQTVRRVVLPEALPGILTGTILALGRAIGETAPLIMVGVATTVFSPPSGFFDRFSAMPMQIYSWVEYPSEAFQYGVMAAGVVTLLVILLAMNASAILIRNRYERR